MGHVTLTTPLLGVACHPKAMCVQNLMILALASAEISLGTPKFKVGHATHVSDVTLTTPL